MYIPPFVCGFIVGAVVATIAIIVLALGYERKEKEDKGKDGEIEK